MKIPVIISLFAICFLSFSCSRLLRPVARAHQNQNPNARNNRQNTNINNRSVANFTGTAIRNIVYSSAVNYKGFNQQLTLDVFKPKDAGSQKFPAVFLVHGGNFVEGDKTNLTADCVQLANNGYVAISINYRLGFNGTMRPSCTDSNFLKQAIYRAMQDAYEAINFIAGNAEKYNIDKNWIFVGGQSAGAITALGIAYLQNNNAYVLFPNFATTMGKLNKADNNDYTIRGVISMWGAFLNPQLITKETALPTIFFQGAMDPVVPFNSRPFAPCATATSIYGTYPLYNRLKDLGVTAIAHVDPQGGHGVFEPDFRIKNILCFLNDVRQGINKQVYLTGVESSCDKN